MTHTTKKRSAFRNGILAVALVLGITLGNIAMATPASAFTAGNIYNNSDHGMWFYPRGKVGYYNQLKWVPAKTWSTHAGVFADGIFIGKGYCADVFISDGRGGWRLNSKLRGETSIALPTLQYEWRVDEWRC